MCPLFQDASTTHSTPEKEYWAQARRPLTCLVFLLPLLLVYEMGVFYFGGNDPASIRNGADFWMRDWLYQSGLTAVFLLPAVVAGVLFAWHVIGRYPWRISGETLAGMLAESVLFALLLIAIAHVQETAFAHFEKSASVGTLPGETLPRMVGFVGAGVYEEFLFRMCLLPACYLVFRGLFFPVRWAVVAAVIGTSLLFSGAHYVGAGGESFELFSFTFRAIAGLFFSILFVMRGFGITVGAHAIYDILVGLLIELNA